MRRPYYKALFVVCMGYKSPKVVYVIFHVAIGYRKGTWWKNTRDFELVRMLPRRTHLGGQLQSLWTFGKSKA